MAMMNEKLWEIKRNIEKEQSEGIRRQKQRKGKTEQEECEEMTKTGQGLESMMIDTSKETMGRLRRQNATNTRETDYWTRSSEGNQAGEN